MITGVEPSVEDSHGVIEAVGAADCDESLTAADSTGAGKGMERGQGKLCLRKRQPNLSTETRVPARRCCLAAGRAPAATAIARPRGNLRDLRRHRPRQQEVPPFARALPRLNGWRRTTAIGHEPRSCETGPHPRRVGRTHPATHDPTLAGAPRPGGDRGTPGAFALHIQRRTHFTLSSRRGGRGTEKGGCGVAQGG
jgi:hypothetical protein